MTEPLGEGNQAHTYLGTYRGQQAVIKSVPDPDHPITAPLYRWMIQREARALRILDDVDGIPDLLGIPNENAIALEYREGVLLRSVEGRDLPVGFFEDLEGLVRSIHEHGVVHSDLKKKENVMASPEGEPIIIDFGTHLVEKEGFNPINNFLYRQFRQMDLNAVSKLKKQITPERLEERDRERLNSPTLLERADRFRRDYVWDW